MTEIEVEIQRLESELELQRHSCRMDWRELHEVEKLIDLKIELAFAHARAGLLKNNPERL
jgi:hypothetical protein